MYNVTDPNYNEVSTDVDMYVEGKVQKSYSFFKKIIDKILLVIKRIWYRIIGKKEIVYKPEPSDLRYVHIGDLTDEKLKEMARKPSDDIVYSKDDALKSFSTDRCIVSNPSTYIIRNRITGSVVITKGDIISLRAQYNNDYEIVEPAIKE